MVCHLMYFAEASSTVSPSYLNTVVMVTIWKYARAFFLLGAKNY